MRISSTAQAQLAVISYDASEIAIKYYHRTNFMIYPVQQHEYLYVQKNVSLTRFLAKTFRE